jgi:NADH/F420H2 dehydrogenase subunit C
MLNTSIPSNTKQTLRLAPSYVPQALDYLNRLKTLLPLDIVSVDIGPRTVADSSASTTRNDELILRVKPESIKKVLRVLRDHTYCKYSVLVDITGVDYPEKKERFEVVYLLLSMCYNARIRVTTYVDELTPLDSVTSLYSAAGWYEREVYDMFGIDFIGHPDLRRLLTDYGFQGHPLRKDFPLTGYYEVRYDETEKRVLSEPVETAQEYRAFTFSSPWSLRR